MGVYLWRILRSSGRPKGTQPTGLGTAGAVFGFIALIALAGTPSLKRPRQVYRLEVVDMDFGSDDFVDYNAEDLDDLGLEGSRLAAAVPLQQNGTTTQLALWLTLPVDGWSEELLEALPRYLH